MTDYGHELLFGSFLTPSADCPADVLALAQLSEQLGLDLVTVQDHPYQARFLETWTLLSVIAGQTSTVRVVPNVTNLPLRPPAVLARAAASLDLLSGGRVELGIGAGAFWDAIVAMGGPRRTPGESVEALAEAITVLRALWAPGANGSGSTAGTTSSAGRAPAPSRRTTSGSGSAPASRACSG
ncbi:LLM class flavin-dependent oxidoreductase [Pengzhenrongella sp.]|jgi:alkanesulfonate monooxygenase SsuD/methylene tetrahydromethanopterin reductase-like flavin-dependent oxidoreductase (luciferase family)|uniref:LLM class flavin-dependent oxidoreductase n=1 Tax=Pengzhenrongella sp. TaxID=2888820 RepID=UPI002F929F9B